MKDSSRQITAKKSLHETLLPILYQNFEFIYIIPKKGKIFTTTTKSLVFVFDCPMIFLLSLLHHNDEMVAPRWSLLFSLLHDSYEMVAPLVHYVSD